MTLYERLLESSYDNLSPLIQKIHRYQESNTVTGKVSVTRGVGLYAWMMNKIMQLPKAQTNANLKLELEQKGEKERWKRTFGYDSFTSIQYQKQSNMVEKMGAIRMYFDVYEKEGSLYTQLIKSTIFGLRIPKYFTVYISSVVQEINQKVNFEVQVSSSQGAFIISYQGEIEC